MGRDDAAGLRLQRVHAVVIPAGRAGDPRLAQDQDEAGYRVDQAQVQPGDLAVWDGHVAAIIGDGLMVEAGDPVQVNPIRTTNLDQGFQGFYRPR